MRTRGSPLVGVLVATLLSTPVFADDPEATAPAAPVAAPSSAPSSRPTAGAPKAAKATEAEPLPDVPARLWIAATSPHGPWTMRIDNEGATPIRIPADVRLLRFEIDPEPYLAPTEPLDPKAKKRSPIKKPAPPVVCKLPAPLRPEAFPEASALLLRPGESYIESFDPRLFCFGKDAAARLAGGAVVHARFGWEAPKQPAWSRAKKPDGGPFAAEGTTFPPEYAPLRELVAPTIVLHFDRPSPGPVPAAATLDGNRAAPAAPEQAEARAQATSPDSAAMNRIAPPDRKHPAGPAPAPATPDPKAAKTAPAAEPRVVDENAPRLELTSTPFTDASSTSRAAITLTATNVGHRPMLIAIHQRMLAFRIDGPDGVLRCPSMPATQGIPRELYRTLKPGASTSMTLLLAEGCTRDALRRPGLYRVQAVLDANESGAEIGLNAYTGKSRTPAPTLLRVLSGPDPFYATAPRAVPTPKPAAAPDGDDGDDE